MSRKKNDEKIKLALANGLPRAAGVKASAEHVRRHIIWHRLWARLRETLLIVLVDIKRRLCGIASVGVR